MTKNSEHRGFSLIELLIVVAIILVIAAIAIPNPMRSRAAANQASAIQSLRMVNTAEVAYSSTYGAGFSSTLLQLGPPASGASASSAAAGLVDSVLAGGFKSGYAFSYSPGAADPKGNYQGYRVTGSPAQPGTSGSTYYYTDQTDVIRGNITGTASSTDSSVAQ
jgi:prepilin-type N-terminal cleavage/methylation domain-containing protein